LCYSDSSAPGFHPTSGQDSPPRGLTPLQPWPLDSSLGSDLRHLSWTRYSAPRFWLSLLTKHRQTAAIWLIVYKKSAWPGCKPLRVWFQVLFHSLARCFHLSHGCWFYQFADWYLALRVVPADSVQVSTCPGSCWSARQRVSSVLHTHGALLPLRRTFHASVLYLSLVFLAGQPRQSWPNTPAHRLSRAGLGYFPFSLALSQR